MAALAVLAAFAAMLWCSGFIHHNGVLYRKRAAAFLLMALSGVLLAAFSPAEERRRKYSRPFFAALSIAAGGFAFQYISCAVNDTVISLPYLPLMLSLSAVIYTVIWLIAGDSRQAGMWYFWFMLVGGYGYECVYLFRGIAFKPLDILSFSTAMAVAGGYDYPLSPKHVFWFLGGVILWGLSGWVKQQKNRRRERRTKLVCTALSVCWMWLLISTSLLSRWNVVVTAFESDAPHYNRIQGTLATLTKECQQLSSMRPSDYSPVKLAASDSRFSEARDLTSDFQPNVIVVMNESLADLTSIRQIDCTEDPLRYLHSLQQTTVSGNLLVSAYGGSTCNTEHSFLTATIPAPQLNMALYSSVRENTPSLAWQLKHAGYRTIAIHPNEASNYQRSAIYPRLGFDQFFSIKDFEGAETIRDLVSDRACYRTILDLLEQKEADERLFIFNVTMQNHGGYRGGLTEQRIALADGVHDTALETYLNLAAESDQALSELIASLAEQPEPTILLVFGDHQPNLDLTNYALLDQSLPVQNRLASYMTPFVIWANYPVQAAHWDAVSINYLAPLLLQTAGLPLTGYDEWLLENMQQYPVVVLSGYSEADGTFHEWQPSGMPDPLWLMNQLRYNRLYDDENRFPALDFPAAPSF